MSWLQAVLKQFAGGLGGSETAVNDDTELQQHQKLEKLYFSTRAGKVDFCGTVHLWLNYLFFS